MKGNILKIGVIITLILTILMSNFLYVGKSIYSYAIENTNNKEKAEVILNIETQKYINYNLDEENKGVLYQAELQTGIQYKEGQEYTPLKVTESILNMPKIEDKYPEQIKVIAKSTEATNGEKQEKEATYDYNKETGKLNIKASNTNAYNKEVKDAKDIYEIYAYYNSNCYKEEKERQLEITGTVIETLEDENETKIEKQFNLQETHTSNKSELISTKISNSEIYNGFIYANEVNGTQNETEYTETIDVNFSYAEIADKIRLELNNQFIDSENNSIASGILYKKTTIKKQDIIDYLGEDGKITILNDKKEVIGEITSKSEEIENGLVEINYPEETEKIVITTTKPIKIGSFAIKNKKAIKADMKNNNYKKLQTTQKVTCTNNEETKEIYNSSNISFEEIKASETNIKVSLDKTKLTNKIQNEITLTATLLNNNIKYNLFKNPVILFTFPSEVEKIILGDVALLYDSNLSIKSAEVVDNNGSKAIKVELDGTQNSYNLNSIIEGSNLVIPATIIVKKEIESKKSTIDVTYKNDTATLIDYKKQGKENKQIDIDIESVIEMQKEQKEDNKLTQRIEEEPLKENIKESEKIKVETIAVVGDKTLAETDTIHEDEIIKYMVRITNTTEDTLNNIKLEGSVPEGTTYAEVKLGLDSTAENAYVYVKDESVKKYEENIASIEAGKSIIRFYEVQVNKLTEGETSKEIQQTLKTYIENIETTSNSQKTTIKNGDLTVRLQSGNNVDKEYGYGLWIYNNTEETIENIKATCQIPVEFDVTNIETYELGTDSEGKTYAKETNLEKNLEDGKLTIKIPEIKANSKANIVIDTIHKNYENGKYEYDISMSAKVSYKDDTYYSNENRMKILTEAIQIVQTSEKEGKELQENEEIQYNITIKNIGASDILGTNIDVQDYLPKALIPDKIEYEKFEIDEDTGKFKIDEKTGKYIKTVETEDISEVTIDEDGKENANVHINCSIPDKEQMQLKIYAKADYVTDRTDIENMVTITGDDLKATQSNIIKATIVPTKVDNIDDNLKEDNTDKKEENNQEKDDNNIENKDNKTNYKIKGVVWMDSDKNGERKEDEQLLSNIKVKLYNATTNSLVKETTTNNNGNYEFEALQENNYMVLFEYDTNNYTLTTYQKSGVGENLNNDAVEKEVSIDGNIKSVGITNIIELSENKENIDMGLIKNSIFDLSLEKYVSKVTVTNKAGTKEYKYKKGKLEKVEIPSKYLNNSTLQIEYKIVVKNEGELEAYVSEIVDYLPSGLTFDKAINNSWRQNTKDTIVSDELAHTKISAGESKEITVVLTKKMTEDETGTITNAAEIKKATSTTNVKDIDSTENNKNREEDDYSEAQLIVSIKTGIITYTIIIVALLGILLLTGFLIKKKKINIKNLMMFMTILMSIVVMNMPNISQAQTLTTKDLKIKDFLKDDMGGKVTVNSSSNNFATHDSSLEEYFNKMKLHCITPNKSMCGSADHTYERVSAEITKIEKQQKVETEAPIISDDSNKSKIKYIEKDNYTYIGPYKVSKIDESCLKGSFDVNTRVVYTTKRGRTEIFDAKHIFDENGKVIENEKNVFKNGKEFYIKVDDKKDNIKNIKEIKLDFKQLTKKVKYKITAIVREVWKCIYSSEGSHNGHGCCNTKDAQDLERVYRGKAEILEPVGYNTSLNLTLPQPKNDVGSLKIIKRDKEHPLFASRTLKGAEFTLIYPTGEKKEGIKTGEDGTVTVSNLPLGKYTVIETKAPEGYTIDPEYAKQEVNIEEKNQVLDVKFYDTKIKKDLGSLKIMKVSKEDGQKLNGAKFSVIGIKGTGAEGYRKDNVEVLYNGTVQLDNLQPGQYLVTETVPPKGYEISDPASQIVTVEVGKITPATVIFMDKKIITKTGQLSAYKYDVDTKKPIPGATFQLWCKNVWFTDNGYGGTVKNETGWYKHSIAVSNSNGYAVWTGLRVDDIDSRDFYYYKVEEIACPAPYDLNDQIYHYGRLDTDLNRNIEVVSSGQFSVYKDYEQKVTFGNKAYGNIRLYKVDDIDVTNIKPMSGVKFKIYYYDESHNKHYISSYTERTNKKTGALEPSIVNYTTNEGSAKEFVTDEKGYINLRKIEAHRKYYAIETGLVNKEDEDFYRLHKGEIELDLQNPNTTAGASFVCDVQVRNQQAYTKLSGIVWEDTHDTSKKTLRNDEYDTRETLIEGIEVRLVYVGSGETVKNEDGKEFITYTDKNGFYEFKKVLKSELDNYNVMFKYNGLKYENVKPHPEKTNGSKSADKDREKLNAQYAIIEKGVSKKADNTETNSLSYKRDSKEHKSTLVQHLGYTAETGKGIVDPKTGSDGIRIYADTSIIELRDYLKVPEGKKFEEVRNINLGIYEKMQPDLAVVKDIQNVRLTINGYEHTYDYAQRFVNAGAYSEGFNVGVKFGNEYGKQKYTRPIYKSDFTWQNPEDVSRELKAYITYKIQIRNEATELKAKINSLVDYYDANYEEIVAIGTELDEKGNIKVNNISKETVETSNNKYKKIIINTEDVNKIINPQETQDIYVQFKLSRAKVLALINQKEEGLLDNIVEINSYSVFDTFEEPYAGIDKDSEPGNIEPEKKETYEDDTDTAPTLQLQVADNARHLKGQVFLDKTVDGLQTAKIREANGLLDAEDTGIDGVKVKIVEKNTGMEYFIGENKYKESISGAVEKFDKYETKATWSEEDSKTSGGGNFDIAGFIPGDYVVVYTWGEQYGTYKVQDYKGTIYNKARYDNIIDGSTLKVGKWYRGDGIDLNNKETRYTDAIDDYKTRLEIDDEIKNRTFTSDEKITKNRTMDSTTLPMQVGVEYEDVYSASTGDQYTYEITNIDFGIVKRAIQQNELKKRVSHLRVTLANGEVVSDVDVENGKLKGEKNHVTYMGPINRGTVNYNPGFIKVELDNELIQGAILEVTYEFKYNNISEVDVINSNYYKFGSSVMKEGAYKLFDYNNKEVGTVKESEVVYTTPNIIIDYLDKAWGYETSKNEEYGWTAITKEQLQTDGIQYSVSGITEKVTVSPDVFGDTSDINNKIILYTTKLHQEKVLPGTDRNIKLNVSKTLTTTDEILLNNETEIVKITKPGGSKITTITGSYIPSDSSTPLESDEDKSEQVIVTPSTGENQNYILPITIGVAVLAILGTGIIILKRKLKK